MTKTELLQKLEQVFQGDPWHGSSISRQLSSIDAENYVEVVRPGKKTIAHLLEHILAWKLFAIEKLKNNASFTIEINSETDWPTPNYEGDPKSYYLNRMNEVHRELVSLLEQKSDEWLSEQTPNKPYSNAYLIQGIVEHDLYHAGQIGIFNALLNAQKSSS